MRLLVTGGCGVIGARVVAKLAARGIRPIVLDARPDFSLMRDSLDRFDFEQGDVTTLESIEAVIARHRIDRVMHLAAFIDPEMAVLPFRSFEVNTRGTVNMLEAARRAGVGRVIAASSRAVYGETPRGVGEPGYRPLDEEHPKRPVGAYDVTKLAAESIGELYRRVHGLEYAA